MKGWKRFLSLLLGLCMLFQTIGMTAVAAKEEEPEEYTTTISHKQQSGETNFFKFADGKWEAGNDTHTWSKPVDTASRSPVASTLNLCCPSVNSSIVVILVELIFCGL